MQIKLDDNSRSFKHKISDDFDEQATFLQNWHQDYAQITSGDFKGFIAEVHFESVSLFWEYTNQRLYQQGCLEPDMIAIGVPLSPHENGLFCGASSEQNAIYFYGGREGFEFISPPNLTIGLVVFKRSALLHLLTAQVQAFLDMQTRHAHLLRVSSVAYLNLVHFFNDNLSALQANPALAYNNTFSKLTSTKALSLVSECLQDEKTSGKKTGRDILCHDSWALFTAARLLNAQYQDNPLSVADLCNALAVSRRSLQYHFEKTLGTSPLVFLRAERLNAVRHMLKDASSVTEAATHWGFWHFGHFSQEYKKMFGELPSATFKRLHNLN